MTVVEAENILDLSDAAFVPTWFGLPEAEKSGFPDGLRTRAVNRYRALTSYVETGIDRIKREQARNGSTVYVSTISADSRASWPEPLDLEILAGQEPAMPASIMEGLPVGYCTTIFGHGGAGKSQIELMRAVCIAAGVLFCGLEVERRRVLFVSCEDRADILHWRLSRICRHLQVDMAGLRGWLTVLDLVGYDSLLFAPDHVTNNALTYAYGLLDAAIQDHESELLVLDGIADVYGASENDRGQVKKFINSLLAIIPSTGAVILIGHVNKATASGIAGEGYSGSTSWHNCARARWYLRAETTPGEDGGAAMRTGKLLLELQKSNHGEVGTTIAFTWNADAHLFVGRLQGGTTEFDRRHQDRIEQHGILLALQSCSMSMPPLPVPAAVSGPRTAYHALEMRPEFPETLRSGKPGVRRFWRQIEALRQMHAIEEGSYRRSNRHLVATLILTAEGMRRCAE